MQAMCMQGTVITINNITAATVAVAAATATTIITTLFV